MRTGLAMMAVMAGLGAGSAMAEESVLVLDQGIAATLNMPEGAGPHPAVLMLHGFGSSRDEVGGMYATQAAALAEQGIASLRIDFRGFGKSDGDTGDHSVTRQNEDAAIGLAALAATEGVDTARLGVLGFSFGGGAAIELAAANPDLLKALVTWSSVGDYDVDFLQSLGQATFDRAAAEGIVGLDLGFRTMALKAGFFDSLAGPDILAALGTYPGAYLSITGDQDYYHRYSAPMLEAAAGAPKDALVIEGADHIFNVFDPETSSVATVIDRTTAFFIENL